MTVRNFRCSYGEHPGKKQKRYCREEVSILCLSPNDKQVEEKLSFFFYCLLTLNVLETTPTAAT